MNKKLMDYNQFWSSAFDDMGEFVFLVDKNFNLIKANKSFIKFSGKTKKTLIGKKCYQLVHGTKESFTGCPHQKALKTKKSERSEFYEPHLKKWLSVGVTPIFDHGRKIVGSIHIAADISERKKAEEALKESEEKYRTLSYNIPGMIYRAGTDWSTQVITNLEEVCGYSIDEWYHQKMNWIDLIHPDDKQGVIASGYAKTKEVDLAQELGAGKYIKKPYTLEKIGVAVKKELEK